MHLGRNWFLWLAGWCCVVGGSAGADEGPLSQQLLRPTATGPWELHYQLRKPVYKTVTYQYDVKVPVTVTKTVVKDGREEQVPVTAYQMEKREATKTVCEFVSMQKFLPVFPDKIAAYETDGRKLAPAELQRRCQGDTLVVVSHSGEKLPEHYASVFKAGTIILVPERGALSPQYAPGIPLPVPAVAPPPGVAPPAVPQPAAPKPPAAAAARATPVQPVAFQDAAAPVEPPRFPLSPAPEIIFVSRDGADVVNVRQFHQSKQDVELTVLASDSAVAPETLQKALRTTRHSDVTPVPLTALRCSVAGGGDDVAPERLKERLGSGETTALWSSDGKLVDPFWLQNVKPGVLVLRGVRLGMPAPPMLMPAQPRPQAPVGTPAPPAQAPPQPAP